MGQRFAEPPAAIAHPKAKTLAVMSGKGGVGKSNVSLNTALAILEKGKSVLLIDLDVGMGNIDILIGRQSLYTVMDLLQQKCRLSAPCQPAREAFNTFRAEPGWMQCSN